MRSRNGLSEHSIHSAPGSLELAIAPTGVATAPASEDCLEFHWRYGRKEGSLRLVSTPGHDPMLDGLPPAVPVGERFLAQIRGHGANLTIRARLIASHPHPLVQVLAMGVERVPCQACGSPFAPDENLSFCEECADYPDYLVDH